MEKLIRYHPVVPFRNKMEIIRSVARCVENYENLMSDKKGIYNIVRNNCESFVNRCVLELDFTELGDKRDGKNGREFTINDKERVRNFNLGFLITEQADNNRWPKFFGEIENYTEVQHVQGIKLEDKIEVYPKGHYWYNDILMK